MFDAKLMRGMRDVFWQTVFIIFQILQYIETFQRNMNERESVSGTYMGQGRLIKAGENSRSKGACKEESDPSEGICEDSIRPTRW
jgi:hypothetical protein